ncbi:hypothetical protein FSP39_009981 [Pinctada imbricata]|uniref:Uncharacterized protein n=1 Tax=Pinctada imbricata TaxID=66713 RepID=A0AA88YQU6_PINIB|nr:hypothetical protein FSP39_009981 [Pinctada imbricata]
MLRMSRESLSYNDAMLLRRDIELMIKSVIILSSVIHIVAAAFHQSHFPNVCKGESELYSHIVKTYNKDIRPCFSERSLTVAISFSLLNINELDEVTGKFSVIGFLYISWEDNRISWNPREFNGTRVLFLPQDMVWKPDLFLRNPFTKIRKLGIDEMVVHYLKSGHAVWQPGDMFESVCRVNVEKYPFDVQTCSLTFLAWGLNKNRLQFRLIKDVVDLDYFTSQGAWNVIDTKAFTFERNIVQYVQFDITMERRSTFVMINMVYPVFLLGVLNLFVFFVPANSGERIGFSLSILLSTVVFLTLISDNLPRSSDPKTPFLCYTLFIEIVLNSCIILCGIVGVRIHHKKTEIPRMFQTCLSCTCKKKNDKEYAVDEENRVTWEDVGTLFDKLCFSLFVIALFLNYYFFYLHTKCSNMVIKEGTS